VLLHLFKEQPIRLDGWLVGTRMGAPFKARRPWFDRSQTIWRQSSDAATPLIAIERNYRPAATSPP
jgi:hypothetical protein